MDRIQNNATSFLYMLNPVYLRECRDQGKFCDYASLTLLPLQVDTFIHLIVDHSERTSLKLKNLIF